MAAASVARRREAPCRCRCTKPASAFERDYILRALAGQQGNISRTADALGVERSNLYRKMKSFGIAPVRRAKKSAIEDGADGDRHVRTALEDSRRDPVVLVSFVNSDRLRDSVPQLLLQNLLVAEALQLQVELR